MTAERRDRDELGTASESADEPTRPQSAGTDTVPPTDAFGALGGETRLAVVRALDADSPRTFSELFDATDEDTSAGFAYHLRQLTDRFVRQRDDDRYELTDAGRSVARALAAGTYTASVDRDPVDLEENCPFCGVSGLVATVTDNVTEVGCRSCDASLLRLSLPPGGYADRDADDLPEALDAHHRCRIESFDDGVCPDCAGPVSATVETAASGDGNDRFESDDVYVPVQAVYDCETCGADLRCPVALTLLDHPAVVSFYHDHGRDVRDRPIWNAGSEWRERLVSQDPWCVVVSVRLDGEDLVLYVAGDGRVVDHRRHSHDDSDGPVSSAGESSFDESVEAAETDSAHGDDRTRGDDGGTDEAAA